MEKQFLCEECGLLFTLNKNRLRHAREKHQGMKRSGNEKRKIAEAICFHFVRKTPWTEDMKRKAEESFEEIIRACDKTFVFVEYESTEEKCNR